MSEKRFSPGDILIFQLESGFGLLKVLAIDETGDADDDIWHVKTYTDLFPDVEFAEVALGDPERLSVSSHLLNMTTRAFESTQVAKISSDEVTESELEFVDNWRNDPDRAVSDRSVRLLLGLR